MLILRILTGTDKGASSGTHGKFYMRTALLFLSTTAYGKVIGIVGSRIEVVGSRIEVVEDGNDFLSLTK